MLIAWTAAWHPLANAADGSVRVVSRRGLPPKPLTEGRSPGILQRLRAHVGALWTRSGCSRTAPKPRAGTAQGAREAAHLWVLTRVSGWSWAWGREGGADRWLSSGQGLRSRSFGVLLCGAGDSLKGGPGTQQALGEQTVVAVSKDKRLRCVEAAEALSSPLHPPTRTSSRLGHWLAGGRQGQDKARTAACGAPQPSSLRPAPAPGSPVPPASAKPTHLRSPGQVLGSRSLGLRLPWL